MSEKPVNESEFDGGLFGLIWINILQWLISWVSFGIAVPWGLCLKERWYAKHTRIDGRQVVFDGKGIQLFGNYIKWFLLSIITLGIYAFWLPLKLKAWVISHTHLE